MAMTFRLSQEQDRLLTELAAAQGVSKQEAAARAVAEAAERYLHRSRVSELSEAARLRHQDLLRRLGE